MPETVWINGKFLSRDDARVSAFDAGLVHGVGLFETMLASPIRGDEAATRGRVFRIHHHMERVQASAAMLGLTESLKVRALQELVEHVVERSEITANAYADPQQPALGRARVRLTITGGDLNMLGSTGKGPTDPTVMIVVQPATKYPAEMFEKGVRIVIAGMRTNPLDPFAGHKTLNYWGRLRELQAASSKGAAEALVLQVTNHLSGGAVSNIFAVKNGALHTPLARGEERRLGGEDLPSPVLPGVTRGAVIDIAESLRIGCATRRMEIADVLDADEVFLTNSSWGVLPVVEVEAKSIGEGVVGPLTRRIHERWIELVENEA